MTRGPIKKKLSSKINKNHITGCHGNHAFSHSANKCIFQNNFVLHLGVPMNNLAPMRNCTGVPGRLNWMPGYIIVIDVSVTCGRLIRSLWCVVGVPWCFGISRLGCVKRPF